MGGRRYYISLLLVLTALLAQSIPAYSQVSCTVPATYPDVSTALLNGCYSIVFTSDVYESGQVYVDGGLTPYPYITIYGCGYRWILPSLITEQILIKKIPNIYISDITIVFNQVGPGVQSNAIFNQTNITILDSVIDILSDRRILYIYNSSLEVRRSIFNKHPDSIPIYAILYGNNFLLYSVNVNDGYGSESLLIRSIGRSSIAIENSYINGSVVISGDQANGNRISILNSTIYSSYSGYALHIIDKGLDAELMVSHTTFAYTPSTGTGVALRIEASTVPSGSYINISDNVFMGSGDIGIGINTKQHSIGELNISISDFQVYGFNIGVDIVFIFIWPYTYGPVKGKTYISISNGEIDARQLGLAISEPVGVAFQVFLSNLSIYSDMGPSLFIMGSQNISVDVIGLETSTGSDVSDIYLVYGANYFGPYPQYLNNFTFRMYGWIADTNLTSDDIDLEILTLPGWRLEALIEYSLLNAFSISGNASIILNETVYNEIYSQAIGDYQIRSIWTLDTQVLSSLTGSPIPNIRIDYLDGYSLVGSALTGWDGHSYITFDYIYDPDEPFIDDLYLAISTSYFNGRWSYMDDFGLLISLPSWYDYLILRIPLLAFKGAGHMYHKPIIIALYGDTGYIYQYVSVADLLNSMLYGKGKPIKIIKLKVLEVYSQGIYIAVKVLLQHYEPMEYTIQWIYINLWSRTIYSPGPYPIVAKY